MADKEQVPKNISEAFFKSIWGKKWSKYIIFLLAIFAVIFAIWNSLPDPIKVNWLIGTNNESQTIEPESQVDMTQKPKESVHPFWANLSKEWKEILLDEASISLNNDTISGEQLKKIFNITQIDISNTRIKDLSPLTNGEFKRLTHIHGNEHLNSIKGISKIEKLYYIDLRNSRIKSIEDLAKSESLELLNLENSDLSIFEINKLKEQRPDVEIKL